MSTHAQDNTANAIFGIQQSASFGSNPPMGPQIALWQSLSTQITATNKKISIPLSIFASMQSQDRRYLAAELMTALNEGVRYVQDPTVNIVYLCPVSTYPPERLSHVSGGPFLLLPASASTKKPKGARKNQNKIPRPCNAFILYRKHFHDQVKAANPGVHNNQISKIIGNQWKSESVAVRADWKAIADKEAQEHARLYPDYQYRPRKSCEKKRRMTKAKAAALAAETAETRESLLNQSPSNASAMVENDAVALQPQSQVFSPAAYANIQAADINSLPWDFFTADFMEGTTNLEDYDIDYVNDGHDDNHDDNHDNDHNNGQHYDDGLMDDAEFNHVMSMVNATSGLFISGINVFPGAYLLN